MATPSSNNPGYYEVAVPKQVPGTVDPKTGFISGGGTVTVIQTYADDGTLAYSQTVGPDGSRSDPTYSPAYSKPGQDIPSPNGPLYRRDDGTVIDPNNIPITQSTPGDTLKTIKDDPGYALRDFKEKVLDHADLGAHGVDTAAGLIGGKGLGGTGLLTSTDNKINGTIAAAASRATGVPTSAAGGSVIAPAAGSTSGPGSGAGGGSAGSSSINVDPIYAAAAASKAMQDKFLAEYNAAHPNQPPAMTASQLPPAVQADMMASIKASQASQLDPITAAHASATLLDPTMQAEQRGRALGLEDQYGDVIAGKAPSVAELQLMQTLERNSANQLGLASRASGGGNVALALRTAANNVGRLNQGASSDAAVLRAKEIADARSGLGGLIDQTRAGDITFAGQNANLATDVSKTNAGLDTNATLKAAELEAARRASNAQLSTTTAMKDADLEAARRAAAATAQNTTNIEQGKLTDAASANNLTAALDQQKIDAAAKDAAAKNAIASGGQVITGTVGAADAQAKAVAAAQAAKDAQDKKDAAWLGAGATTVSALL